MFGWFKWRSSSLVLLLSLLPLAIAQALDLKIGIVDARAILDKAPQAKLAGQRLDEEFAVRNERIVDARKALQALEAKLAEGDEMMTGEERRELDNQIRIQRRELQRSSDELMEDLNIRRNEELSKLQQQIVEAIVNLAKEEKFDLILNHTAAVYWGERVDLTDEVLGRLAEQTGVASP
jgi:outer membrane protein